MVYFYDTTLRDGTQAEGISFSAADKVRIAVKLDLLGVRYIEGGWPGSNPKDMEFFDQVRTRTFRKAVVTAFGSTRRASLTAEKDENLKKLVAAGTKAVTIFGKSWLLHVNQVLRVSPAENLKMIGDSVAFLKKRTGEVIYDAEHFFDGYRDDPEYALKTLAAAQKAGADVIVLCDTNGGSLPGRVAEVVRAVRKKTGVPLGIHCHNDSELAVANSIAAVENGAVQVQGTINGYGERAGNANLCSIIPIVGLKMGRKASGMKLDKLVEISRFVDELANIRHNSRLPFVGESAFAHKGGMHVNAVEKVAASFEHIDPATVGNHRRILISELSGRSNIAMKASELGLNLGDNSAKSHEVLGQIKSLEHQGYEFEAAEASFELLVKKALAQHKKFFNLQGFRVIVEKRGDDRTVSEATVKIRVGGQTALSAAEGDGPVNALDGALRKVLEKFYPAVSSVKLTDFKVRVLGTEGGTGARVRVLIESTDGRRTWGTVGVSENIIEASWQALVDSVEYKLLNMEKSQ